MGNLFNPGNDGFECDRNNKIYVDKTELLAFLNKRVRTSHSRIGVSHAKRFGKSYAAKMISAYYSRGCDSSKLFEGTKISQNPHYKEHLNKYNVIYLDVSSIWDSSKEDIIEEMIRRIYKEFKENYSSELEIDYDVPIPFVLYRIYEKTKIPFVIIMDEWDCVIRNSDNQELVYRYIRLLHALFKSHLSDSFLALGYITGLIPIKQTTDESGFNNCDEFTMLNSYQITEYYGFTDDEVKELCKEYDMDYDSMKDWYDGYIIDEKYMYNPNSVVEAIQNRKFDSYCKNISSYETIKKFITLNYEELKDAVLNILGSNKVFINTDTFPNDLHFVSSKNEALTALVHLGYLAYDNEYKNVHIPNYEVRIAFEEVIKDLDGEWSAIAQTVSTSDELLEETIKGNSARIAELIEFTHNTTISSLRYNNADTLNCALRLSYFSAPTYYNVIREFPRGKGFADVVFIPKANAGSRPAMVIELKYDKSADTAIKQIKEKRYAGFLKDYTNKILLVEISYDYSENDRTKHTCIIEEYQP